MWKLTVEKLNENETGGYEYATDKVNFSAETVEQLVDVMETFQIFGVGKFKYSLIEEKEEKIRYGNTSFNYWKIRNGKKYKSSQLRRK